MYKEEANHPKNTVEPCTHHWIIGTSSGPTSHGTCIKCDTQGDFDNNPDSVPKIDLNDSQDIQA